MKAVRYIVETCILDEDNDINAILVNEQRGAFVPLYLSIDCCESLLDYFNGNPSEEDKLSWGFVMSTWIKLGFQPVSIIVDHQGDKGTLLPTMTFLQNQANVKLIYVSCLIPMGAAVLVSSILNVPFYMTESAESVVKRIDLSKLNEYIEQVSVPLEEDEDEDET